jgi:SM-20-related protein
MLEVRDNALSEQAHQGLCQRLDHLPWMFGHGSVQDQGRPFWKIVLDGDAATDAVWTELKPWCEQRAGESLVVLRQYANGHTYGQGGLAHTDDQREGAFTLLVYPMAEWRADWAGDTVYYGPDGTIARRISPQPRRAVFFDARIPHAGLAPSEAFTGLRRSVAFKLLRRSVFAAQPLPALTLERFHCEPFDARAQRASDHALKANLLERLALLHTEPLDPGHLEVETQRVQAACLQLDAAQVRALAEHRLRSGLGLLQCARALGFEPGAPNTESRTIQALIDRATITTVMMDRQALVEL